MSADHLHPAIDIPGGLWRGAVVQPARGGDLGLVDAVTERPGRTVVTVTGYMSAFAPADLLLDLHAPDGMGLGLAGLAGRVAARVDYEWPAPTDALLDLAEYLADEEYAPIWWRHWYGDGRIVDVIREAATLTARLDRLASAVDPAYTVRPGVVPEWDRVDPWPDAPEEINPHAGWRLTLHEAGRQYPRVTIWHDDVLELDTPDPLAALGAALEVCGG